MPTLLRAPSDAHYASGVATHAVRRLRRARLGAAPCPDAEVVSLLLQNSLSGLVFLIFFFLIVICYFLKMAWFGCSRECEGELGLRSRLRE